jgi:cytochrome c oxidase subunit 4
MNDAQFKRHTRHLALAWAALIALMLASLGSAYLALGAGNAIAGLVIAAVKAGLVVIVFMRLGHAAPAVRLAAAAALATWLLLAGLSGVDYATRPNDAAVYQQPP